MNLLTHKKLLILFLFILTIGMSGYSQNTQTIRGKVIDQDAKTPIIGANIIINDSNPLQGTSTDINGNFRIDNVKVGRVNLKISCLGYIEKIEQNILVGAGKEVVLEIELVELIVTLDDAIITASRHKSYALNEMAKVSAKAFTVEETKRYAGSLNDPARMVSGYAGVTGDARGNNDIVVRGNSPKGVLWRLDGFDIPNPNHFSTEGSTGGPVNALNSSILSKSDFLSGAFPSEYGNAYSGVFDMKLRSGNNQQREYSTSIGIQGIDATLEGPVKNGYTGSYLVNYRYSSLDLLERANLIDYFGIPRYQDLALKIVLPTKNTGTFSLIGLGGLSNIDQENVDEETDYLYGKSLFGADFGFAGLNHLYSINDHTYIKSMISHSATQNEYISNKRYDDSDWYLAYQNNFINNSTKIGSYINTKLSSRHRLRYGVTFSYLDYKINALSNPLGDSIPTPELDAEGNTGLLQGYLTWKYRIAKDLTLVTGLHYIQLLLNNSYSIEPRLALEWEFSNNQSLTVGAGIHSKHESIAVYFATVENNDGSFSTPNRDLGLSKAAHCILGYNNRFSKNMNLKLEIYYQYLYDLAVENDPNSMFILNNIRNGYVNRELINEGSGKNYGVEITLERFYMNDFYFLFTTSLYESKLTALDNIERNARFNGNYVGNLLIGKEFHFGKQSKNRKIGINSKITLIGGHRYSPIDLETSISEGYGVYDETRLYALKGNNIFILNLAWTYRRNTKKTTREFKIDFQNLTNHQAKVYEYYDYRTQSIGYVYQLAMMPSIIYTIQF